MEGKNIMENGIYAARAMDGRIDGVYIDQERIEMERQNKRVRARRQSEVRREEEARAEAVRRAAIMERRKRQAWRFVRKQGKLLAAALIIFAGHQLGYGAWEFAAPVLVGIQTVICFRAGRYFGQKPHKEMGG